MQKNTIHCINAENNSKAFFSAKNITSCKRVNIAIKALSKTISITDLAIENGSSRKFIYKQKKIKNVVILKTVFIFHPSPYNNTLIVFFLFFCIFLNS